MQRSGRNHNCSRSVTAGSWLPLRAKCGAVADNDRTRCWQHLAPTWLKAEVSHSQFTRGSRRTNHSTKSAQNQTLRRKLTCSHLAVDRGTRNLLVSPLRTCRPSAPRHTNQVSDSLPNGRHTGSRLAATRTTADAVERQSVAGHSCPCAAPYSFQFRRNYGQFRECVLRLYLAFPLACRTPLLHPGSAE